MIASGYLIALVIVIILLALIGVASGLGLYLFRKRAAEGKKIPKPFVKYVSLSTNDDENELST